MQSFIEPLFKSANKISFGWTPEPISGVTGYNVYVGQVPGSLNLLLNNVSPGVSQDVPMFKKVPCEVTIDAVRNLLGLSSSQDFSNLLLYWSITYIDSSGPSDPALSRIVEVPPVGILGKTKKEDPSANRNIFGFSDELQRWIKGAASGKGAIIIDQCDLFKTNITTEYTYSDGTNLATIKSYFSDRTTAGSPAKLTTNTWIGSQLKKTVITDSTV